MKEGPYNPGQAAVLFPFWPDKVDWFLLGGPSDADEAQTIHARYPQVKCVGFEPHRGYLEYQKQAAFPGDLHPVALWDSDGEVRFFTPDDSPRSSSPAWEFTDETGVWTTVPCRSLDSLDGELGPFTNAVLWLDIEYSEVRALEGAAGLLGSGRVKILNVELWDSNHPRIESLLLPLGYRPVLTHAHTIRDKRDVVYRLEK